MNGVSFNFHEISTSNLCVEDQKDDGQAELVDQFLPICDFKHKIEVSIWWPKNIIEVPININKTRMSTTKCCATPIYGWQRPCVRSPNNRSVCFQGKIKPEQVLFLQTQDAGLDVKLKLTIDQKLEKPSQRHPERSTEDWVICLAPP